MRTLTLLPAPAPLPRAGWRDALPIAASSLCLFECAARAVLSAVPSVAALAGAGWVQDSPVLETALFGFAVLVTGLSLALQRRFATAPVVVAYAAASLTGGVAIALDRDLLVHGAVLSLLAVQGLLVARRLRGLRCRTHGAGAGA